MFEDVFVSDSWLLNFIVFLNLYWYVAAGAFFPAVYYIFLKIFTFPLITRKAHEFVLVMSPESVKIKKITARLAPFFYHNKNAYWFDSPSQDVNSLNKYNIYIEGINQSITHGEKHPDKVHDILKEIYVPKQISTHKILFPTRLKEHLNRHFVLIVSANGQFIDIQPVKERQPLRVSFYHTLGVYLQKTIQAQEEPLEEQTSAGSQNEQKLQLVRITTQSVLEQIKFAAQYRYYNSHYSYLLSKKVQRMEKNFMFWVRGSIDPKIIISLIILMGTVAGIVAIMYMFGNPKMMLGPMPTG